MSFIDNTDVVLRQKQAYKTIDRRKIDHFPWMRWFDYAVYYSLKRHHEMHKMVRAVGGVCIEKGLQAALGEGSLFRQRCVQVQSYPPWDYWLLARFTENQEIKQVFPGYHSVVWCLQCLTVSSLYAQCI